MSKIIVEKIKDKKNVLLAGDLNVLPNTKSISNIEKHLKNIFKGKVKTTFNVKRKAGQKTTPIISEIIIDYIFASSDLKIINSHCPQVDISDHLPLICNFEI